MADTESLDKLEAKAEARPKKKCAGGLALGQKALLMFLLFVIYIFLHSDMFLDSVGGLWTGASDANGLTDKGIYITALLCVLMVTIAYTLVSYNLL